MWLGASGISSTLSPDLGFTVGYVSRFLEDPREDHMAVVKHILRYVAGTTSWGMWYGRKSDTEASLIGYCHSDYAGDLEKRQSMSGIIFFLGVNPITWQSMKQKLVAQSSCEAEYIPVANATCQALWLSRVLAEIQGRVQRVPILKVDNKSAIALIKNPVLTRQTRHIEVKYHSVRESAARGQISVEFIGTIDQLGDKLTKSLSQG
jgi:hypothetical protein